MDVSALAGAVSDAASGSVKGAAQVADLKKAMQMRAEGAMALVQSLPQPAPVQPTRSKRSRTMLRPV